jgi:hypothetical protein
MVYDATYLTLLSHYIKFYSFLNMFSKIRINLKMTLTVEICCSVSEWNVVVFESILS